MGSPAWEEKTKRFSIAIPKWLYYAFEDAYGSPRRFIRAAMRKAINSGKFFEEVTRGDYETESLQNL